MRITSGLVANAASIADRASSASATISKSGSRSRIWRMPTRNSAWSSTMTIRTRSYDWLRRSLLPRRRSGPWYSVIRSPFASSGSASRTTVPASGRERTSKRAPTSSARSRMNWSPKLRRPRAATAPVSNPRPSSRTSSTHSPPSSIVATTTFVAPACLRTFCRASCTTRRTTVCVASVQVVGRCRELACVMCRPDSAACVGDGVGDRAVQPELDEHGRPQLADEACGRRPARDAAARAGTAARSRAMSRVGVEDAVDELHLEDRVRERLGGSVVDLLGEPDALALLGLDDPHLELGRERSGGPRR